MDVVFSLLACKHQILNLINMNIMTFSLCGRPNSSCHTCCAPNLLAFYKRLHFSVSALSRFVPAGLQDGSLLLISAHQGPGVSSNNFLINVHLPSLHRCDKQKPCTVPCSPLKACISFLPPYYMASTFCKGAAHPLAVMTLCPWSKD